MKCTRPIDKVAHDIVEKADKLADMVADLRHRATLVSVHIAQGKPTATMPCLGAEDIASLAASLQRHCGYFDALQSIAFDKEHEVA